MSDVCEELVSCVLCLGRECERSLKQEVEVRVMAYDPSVETVGREVSYCGDVAVVVTVGVQPVYLQGVDPDF